LKLGATDGICNTKEYEEKGEKRKELQKTSSKLLSNGSRGNVSFPSASFFYSKSKTAKIFLKSSYAVRSRRAYLTLREDPNSEAKKR
jgi:hypothetical protein